MANKNHNLPKIPIDFWKGLGLGIFIALIGTFVYFKVYPSTLFPPTNSDCYTDCLSSDNGNRQEPQNGIDEANIKVVKESPSEALGLSFQTMGHALGCAMQCATGPDLLP